MDRSAPIKHVQDVFAFPSPLANDQKVWAGRVLVLLPVAPDFEHSKMIFARFDRPQHDEVGLIKRWGIRSFVVNRKATCQPGYFDGRLPELLCLREPGQCVSRVR